MAVRELTVSSVEPYAHGYELVRARADIALDPADPANAPITDIGLAPVDDTGAVAVHADVVLLRPADPAQSNGGLLYTVANRGDVSMPFGIGAGIADRGQLPPGDGFLLRTGWTLAWSGWQFDVPRGPATVGIDVPVAALSTGLPAGLARVRFAPLRPAHERVLADWTSALVGVAGAVYPAAEGQPDAVLTVQDTPDGAPAVIGRSRWRFTDPGHVRLDDGFTPGRFYDLVYRTTYAPVVGCGLAAVRDVARHLRGMLGSTHVVGYGVSQSGRFLRALLAAGLNADEHGDRVFDGVFCHLAGARRGEFNHRYALPSEGFAPGFGDRPPYTPHGLLAGAGGAKLVVLNSSWEYWRGDASLGHIEPDGSADVPEHPDARSYLIAGSDHVGDAAETARLFRLANPANGLDHTAVARALLVALQRWLVDGVAPPPSRVPRLADGTAVDRPRVLAAVPGLSAPPVAALPTPQQVRGDRYPLTTGPPLRCFVAAVDADGNETCGIALPENAVPLATRTGWNTGRAQPGQLAPFFGSRAPFPRTADPADPRRAIQDRYPGRDAYRALVQAAAETLVRQRFLLAEDVPHTVHAALRRYDELQP